jgi:hypothetical protein
MKNTQHAVAFALGETVTKYIEDKKRPNIHFITNPYILDTNQVGLPEQRPVIVGKSSLPSEAAPLPTYKKRFHRYSDKLV